MAQLLQERYSDLVLAKLRNEIVLKDGVVFNNDFDGDPAAGAVKIPTRDDEVAASDYDRAAGLAPTTGNTAYTTLTINRDKAVNEIIDGYEASAVPDTLVAERLDSAGYSLGRAMDLDGATELLGAGTVVGVGAISKDTVYGVLVDQRTQMSKDNIPATGRYALCTPDVIASVVRSPEFTQASSLGDEVKQSGAIGRIAGFNVIEFNDSTPNLAVICGHPRFATRVNAWQAPVRLQSLDGSGKYIGASAVQGRMVYAHKVLRQKGVRCVYAPTAMTLAAAPGATLGATLLTIADASEATIWKYTLNPASRAVYGAASSGTALTSGTTEIAAVPGDVVEVVGLKSSKIVSAGYISLAAANVKA
ncbi:MAG TPA: hypothetical protein PLP25_01550 [Candidatus Limiplasma sp.]|nr:hypothetical protein [Candidatus Limiplasma sp.]HPS80530.1 hypothetical protein [Candidatus Limiplasma sp.]